MKIIGWPWCSRVICLSMRWIDLNMSCYNIFQPSVFIDRNCMILIKKLSTIHIEECLISLVLMTLLTIGTLEIAEFLIEGMLILYFCCLIRNKIWPPKKEEIEMNEKSKWPINLCLIGWNKMHFYFNHLPLSYIYEYYRYFYTLNAVFFNLSIKPFRTINSLCLDL